MRLISSELGLAGKETFFLAKGTKDEGKPLTYKTTPYVKRIDKAKLEQMYCSDPTVFNSINKMVQVIMAAGWKLMGDEESVDFFEGFLESIGSTGGELDWDSLLELDLKYSCIYGDSWTELIYNKKGNQVVDLDFVDPKKMDYAKDSTMRIALDAYMNPVGYVEKVPMEVTVVNKIPAPPDVALLTNEIFLPPERIVHYKLYSVGDGFYPIGLVEPIYNTALRKLNMEQALANSWWMTGFPLKKGKVGDLNHEPTEEHMQRMAENIKNLDYRSSIVMPYYADVELLEAAKPEKRKEILKYYNDQEITGMGIPGAYATGAGEATNRATLARQEYLLKLTLKDIVKRITRTTETKIFKPVAKMEGLKSYPKIRWGEIALEELDSRSKRLIGYASSGLVTPDITLEEFIRKFEDLPEKPKIKEG
jgi:hypothetical protein